DLEHTEAEGRLDGAEPSLVSDQALARGEEQCGTLGSGNHFLEVQVVDHVFDEEAAQAMGLEKDMVCVMIHSGSRGLGYQVCDDALHMLRKAPEKYGINLPDRQLACAPVNSPEGQKYIGAMRAAANFAWCNRQIGQPGIIPGDMGRASWVLVGQPGSMEKTFGTTCHGAGRAMSRTAAVKDAAGRRIDKELEAKGIIARAQSHKGLAEEQPKAYKNVDDVVDVVDRAGLSRKVARMRPIGVIKG